MWGYLENKVFATPPQIIEELRQRIIDEFNVSRQQPEIIRSAVRHLHKRTIIRVEANGGLFSRFFLKAGKPINL